MSTKVEQCEKEITLIRFDENQKHELVRIGKTREQYHGTLIMGYKGKERKIGYYIQKSRRGMAVYTVDGTPMTGELLHIQRKTSKKNPYMQPNNLHLSDYGKEKVKEDCREFLAAYVLLYTKTIKESEEDLQEKLREANKKIRELEEQMSKINRLSS